MTLTSKFLSAAISDIHFVHANTPTIHIIHNLRKAFPDNETTAKLNMIWIVGDVWDQIAYASDPNIHYVKIWFNSLLRVCAKYDIMVRIMEGTPKHDRKQNILLTELAELGEINVDIRYIDKLEIEHIDRFNIDVLYVPDEWTSGNWASSTVETWREVKALLAKNGLEQVDFTLLHGAFDFQLPPTKEHLVHIPENYESITRHIVHAGHIHHPSQRGKILTNGSFDRLTHGEEHPKGHWRVTIDPQGKDKIQFIENTGAMIYKTVTVLDPTIESGLTQVAAEVNGLPEHSKVRVKAAVGHPILATLEVLRKQYPKYQWSGKAIEPKDAPTAIQQLEDTTPVVATEITPENIQAMVEAKLAAMGVDPTLRLLCAQRLKETTHDLHH